ncbi:MAG: PAS domain-containing sensor histidine kinase [Novosphingobium sp.]|nr:MAG: PAS domain-containing sensor histidine kinase [Novosphingobium sp.]
MVLDAEDRVWLWNGVFPEMLELPLELLSEGAPVMPLIRALADRGEYGPGDPAALADAIAANIHSRQPARGEREMVNGRVVEVAWIPFEDGAFLFRLRDVTAERSAARFKDELVTTVSHELRTPLTAIVGALGLLQGGLGGPIEPRGEHLIDVAGKNADRLARIVNDLLEIDKLEAGMFEFRFEPIDVIAMLRDSIEQNQIYAQSRGVEIDLEVPEAPITAEVDRDRMLQVMDNLLSNAAKFSPEGSRVRVRLRPGAEGLRISVIDRGPGISEEFRQRLFSRFAQESRDGHAGAGLGLAISKGIVKRHGGRIHVNTREGVGTIFHVDLPFDQAPADKLLLT